MNVLPRALEWLRVEEAAVRAASMRLFMAIMEKSSHIEQRAILQPAIESALAIRQPISPELVCTRPFLLTLLFTLFTLYERTSALPHIHILTRMRVHVLVRVLLFGTQLAAEEVVLRSAELLVHRLGDEEFSRLVLPRVIAALAPYADSSLQVVMWRAGSAFLRELSFNE